MSAYGYEIVQTLIVDIEPDEHVKRAMNEINAGNVSSISSNEYQTSFQIPSCLLLYSLSCKTEGGS